MPYVADCSSDCVLCARILAALQRGGQPTGPTPPHPTPQATPTHPLCSMTAAFRGAQLLRLLGLAAVLVVVAAVADDSPRALRADSPHALRALRVAKSGAAAAAAAAGDDDVELTFDCTYRSGRAVEIFNARAVKPGKYINGDERIVKGRLCAMKSWRPLKNNGKARLVTTNGRPVLLISTYSGLTTVLGVPVKPHVFGTALVLNSGAHTMMGAAKKWSLKLDVVKATEGKKVDPDGNSAYTITIPRAVFAAFVNTLKAKTRTAAKDTKNFLVLTGVTEQSAKTIMAAVAPALSKVIQKCPSFKPEYRLDTEQRLWRRLARAFRQFHARDANRVCRIASPRPAPAQPRGRRGCTHRAGRQPDHEHRDRQPASPDSG